MDYGTGSLSCSGVVEAISLPSGSQLKDFPSAVRKEMQRIAVALLRRLLYPIMCRRMAQSYRNQTVKKLGDTGRFGSVLVKTLRQRSSLGSAMRRKKFLEDLDDRNPCVKALKESVTYRLYLKDEFIQYRGEPPNAVVFVVKGSIRRCATIEKVKKKRAALPKFSFSTEEMLASEYGSTQSCLCSVAADSGLNIQSEPTGAEKKTVLTAPVMVGEYCTVGNFPCPEYLVADSQFVIIGWIPKSAYCALLEALSQGIQRSILTRALKARERELPNYAPMTLSRMRMCPLLAQLGDDKVSTLMSQLVPQVCPAGVQIDGSSVQKHIYFIRRGVVYLQQDESTSQKNFCPSMPMSRSFYMEGHTFGERQCIFREALNSSFYTLVNVDLYLLPFSCVTQMMESNIDIRTQKYRSCQAVLCKASKISTKGMALFPPFV
uniref:WGS project CAEQ00000000 data, annotated contig 2168 n=1 Tax=Trypanosoma congolense (strain IL3000) TaxID=1068625 RepID=F9WC07_TRYCI|nr:unnamed protein product [Trypanosoma congolense IL3000]